MTNGVNRLKSKNNISVKVLLDKYIYIYMPT